MKPVESLCILLSTCDAYAAVAGQTQRMLALHWPRHPRLFTCGLSEVSGDDQLPFQGSDRDWIGITRQAFQHLRERGHAWAYLILDDHPPMGPCNVQYLNQDLPRQAETLSAIQVNLLGWDQYQPQHGRVLSRRNLYWQNNDPEFRWKFSLHPGLWHVASLCELLDALRRESPEVQSARSFEGDLDAVARRCFPSLRTRTYRIRGDGYAAGRHWYEQGWSRRMVRPAVHAARLLAGLGGETARASMDERLLVYLQYLNGPYPMFWSGLIQRRQLHERALRFLQWSGQGELADAIRSLPMPPPLSP